MVNFNFEPVKINENTQRAYFPLYALGDNDGKFYTVGTLEDIARAYCKAKGIRIYVQPLENERAEFWTNVDDDCYMTLDYSQNDYGLDIEDCYDLYFSRCLNDSDFTIYGLRLVA